MLMPPKYALKALPMSKPLIVTSSLELTYVKNAKMETATTKDQMKSALLLRQGTYVTTSPTRCMSMKKAGRKLH